MSKQRRFFKVLTAIMGISMLFSVVFGSGCDGHKHTFDQQVKEPKYVKSEKTCVEATQYYYSCLCGEKGEETFSFGTKAAHSYTECVAEDKYLKSAANCQSPAVYYMSCEYCGRSSGLTTKSFQVGEIGDHAYTKKVAEIKYLATEATFEQAATYYKSCVCGLKGTETFSHGDPIPTLTDEEREGYKPVSLTMTLYEPADLVYGFTYNTQKEPLRPVIQIEEGTALTDAAQEYDVTYSRRSSYDASDHLIYYYVAKATVDLDPLTTYTYRVYDKYAGAGSESVTFQTKDSASTSFSFSHVSDTQSVPSSGNFFGQVLDFIDSDFILHTGDIVEYSKYEYEWTDMLHANFEYLSKIPMMALSGNHDTVYKAGSDELVKHFNNKIPQQATTATGYYYSFTYGNAKFIMLNTNNNNSWNLEAAQFNWLIDELENNDSDWTIVGMHAPLYSIGQWGADPSKNQQSLALRKQLEGVFAEYGVDIVLQGHDHLISRTNPINEDGEPTTETWQTDNGVDYSVNPDGVIYVMDGMVGTNYKGIIGVEEGVYKYAQTSSTRTWADITIDGNELTFELKSYNGAQVVSVQTWGIKKSA